MVRMRWMRWIEKNKTRVCEKGKKTHTHTHSRGFAQCKVLVFFFLSVLLFNLFDNGDTVFSDTKAQRVQYPRQPYYIFGG